MRESFSQTWFPRSGCCRRQRAEAQDGACGATCLCLWSQACIGPLETDMEYRPIRLKHKLILHVPSGFHVFAWISAELRKSEMRYVLDIIRSSVVFVLLLRFTRSHWITSHCVTSCDVVRSADLVLDPRAKTGLGHNTGTRNNNWNDIRHVDIYMNMYIEYFILHTYYNYIHISIIQFIHLLVDNIYNDSSKFYSSICIFEYLIVV